MPQRYLRDGKWLTREELEKKNKPKFKTKKEVVVPPTKEDDTDKK